MASIIITCALAGALATLFASRHRLLAFGLLFVGLIVPVKWVVFPVSAYLAQMSAQQIFLDFQHIFVNDVTKFVGLLFGHGANIDEAFTGLVIIVTGIALITKAVLAMTKKDPQSVPVQHQH